MVFGVYIALIVQKKYIMMMVNIYNILTNYLHLIKINQNTRVKIIINIPDYLIEFIISSL
jgi:hypothetical protein